MEANKRVDGRQNLRPYYQKTSYERWQRHVVSFSHVKDGKVGDVVVGIGETLVSHPLSVDQAKHYVGKNKGIPAIAELINIKNGVPVKTSVTNLNPTRAMQFSRFT